MSASPPKREARVLVVSHEASRTGAPRVALDIIDSLASEGWACSVVIRWDGPLSPEFAATAGRAVLEPLRRMRAVLRRWRPTRRVANIVEQLAALIVIGWLRPDVVWCNTVLSACYVRPASLLGKRVVLHAHEPGERIAQVLDRYRLGRYWSRTVLVGCAPRVCTDLAAATGRLAEAVTYLPSVPNLNRVLELSRSPMPALPAHGVLVGACGTPNRTKGVDLWLTMVAQVASSVDDLDPHFVWIGGDPPAGYRAWAAEYGLSERVTFTGLLGNPFPLLAALDVFTLTSRTDPFPLVVLEAMHLARPVVAFAVGDVAEQLGDAGRLVAPLATSQAAAEVVALIRGPGERRRLGAAASERARRSFSMQAFTADVGRLAAGPTGGAYHAPAWVQESRVEGG